MSSNVDYIGQQLIKDKARSQQLATAAKKGARSTIKGIVNYFVSTYYPQYKDVTWAIDTIIDFVFDVFKW